MRCAMQAQDAERAVTVTCVAPAAMCSGATAVAGTCYGQAWPTPGSLQQEPAQAEPSSAVAGPCEGRQGGSAGGACATQVAAALSPLPEGAHGSVAAGATSGAPARWAGAPGAAAPGSGRKPVRMRSLRELMSLGLGAGGILSESGGLATGRLRASTFCQRPHPAPSPSHTSSGSSGAQAVRPAAGRPEPALSQPSPAAAPGAGLHASGPNAHGAAVGAGLVPGEPAEHGGRATQQSGRAAAAQAGPSGRGRAVAARALTLVSAGPPPVGLPLAQAGRAETSVAAGARASQGCCHLYIAMYIRVHLLHRDDTMLVPSSCRCYCASHLWCCAQATTATLAPTAWPRPCSRPQAVAAATLGAARSAPSSSLSRWARRGQPSAAGCSRPPSQLRGGVLRGLEGPRGPGLWGTPPRLAAWTSPCCCTWRAARAWRRSWLRVRGDGMCSTHLEPHGLCLRARLQKHSGCVGNADQVPNLSAVLQS